MDKKTADKKIFEYRDRIFGFALDKVRNIDQAQELASDIMCEVYSAFLKPVNIPNPDGYVYRIARNVWAKYVHKLETGRQFEDISNMEIAAPEDNSEDELAMQQLLRREIGYLSERQRTVIYMHYYDKLTVADIAKRLEISVGTVKWHLSDARTKLKAGIDMDFEKNLDIDPIRFTNMGHSGSPGSTGDTSTMFDTRLKQNIAWACYHQPRTLQQIARAVGVPQVYAADELQKLVDYAYIDRIDNSSDPRYLTNMIITDSRIKHDFSEAFDKAAEYLSSSFFAPLLEEFEKAPDKWGFEGGCGDIGYYKYGLLFIVQMHLHMKTITEADIEGIRVKRPDGGDFIALATVYDDKAKTDEPRYKYWICGLMTRESDSFSAYMTDCFVSSRERGWKGNLQSDWESLEQFIRNGKDSLAPEQYKRLCDIGFLDDDNVMPIIIRRKGGLDLGSIVKENLRISEEQFRILTDIGDELDRKVVKELVKGQPEHISKYLAKLNENNLASGEILARTAEKLIDKGLLPKLTEAQRKTVFSIMCIKDEQS